MARTAIIIPARYASTRFPGKPLQMLAGPGGARPLLDWTWAAGEAAAAALPGEVELVVATDDARIAGHGRDRGMAVVMTPESCRNGTERCAAALGGLKAAPDLVINLQGDAPLLPAAMAVAVADALRAGPELALATVAVPASPATLAHLQADAAAGRVGGTTMVCDGAGRALYFSKSIIPHVPAGQPPLQPVLLHVGLYAYRPAALLDYAARAPGALERQEGLEQLRFLEAGLPVGVARCAAPGWDLIELNNPQDVGLVEAGLARRAMMEAA